MATTIVRANKNQGPLQTGFTFELEDGYSVLVGPNEAGKSSILQMIFKSLFENQEYGPNGIIFIPVDRMFVATSLAAGHELTIINGDTYNRMQDTNLDYQHMSGAYRELNTSTLLSHTNHFSQLQTMMVLLESMELPEITIGSGQKITFEDVAPGFHGTGLRSILPILAAITSDNIKVIIIDEPEISLEPTLQKRLREIFYQASQTKKIIISTHSHLLLNRDKFDMNYAISRANSGVSVDRVLSTKQLYDITFNLLGNSLEDLFLPRNFMIVEGSSDQAIVEKIMEIRGIGKYAVKVVSAVGVENVRDILSAVSKTLLPLVLSDSPYKGSAVALIDRPADPSNFHYQEIKRTLGERLFELDATSLEEYIPEHIYERCGRNKSEDLESIRRSKGHTEKNRIKREVSEQVSREMTEDDLGHFGAMVRALERAAL